MHPQPRWVRLALAVLFVALAAVTIQSVRVGLSGLVVELAQGETDRWAAMRRGQSPGEVTRVAAYFTDSLAFLPGNPWALEGLGALDLRRMRLSRTPAESVAYARDARLRFREALRQRPTSPFLWANLALSKLYLDEFDAEFFAALRHADELGPWEPSSQQIVLFASLAAWNRLDPGMRQSTARILERGGVRNAAKMFEIVKGYRRFDLVCPLKSYHAQAAGECSRHGGAAIRRRAAL